MRSELAGDGAVVGGEGCEFFLRRLLRLDGRADVVGDAGPDGELWVAGGGEAEAGEEVAFLGSVLVQVDGERVHRHYFFILCPNQFCQMIAQKLVIGHPGITCFKMPAYCQPAPFIQFHGHLASQGPGL